MPAAEFWKYFDETAAEKLGFRADTFRQMFAYLDRYERPVGIVETGCVRREENWSDGCSTVLFAKYAETRPGSAVYSVDIDPAAVALCKSLVGEAVRVECRDSVGFLKWLADSRPADLPSLDLLYLDSYDVNFDDPLPSAIHHLKEFAAIAPLVTGDTLVVVDDSPLSLLARQEAPDRLRVLGNLRITGKGKLLAEYAAQIGARRLFSDYQTGWLGFGRPSGG